MLPNSDYERHCRVQETFNMKIKYNFKLHVLLTPKGVTWNKQDILQKIYSLKGYKCHKVIKYGTHWSHLHIKFIEEQHAEEAVYIFTELNSGLIAVSVEDALRDWFSFEMRSNCYPHWTLTVVDIIGTTPHSLNFLTEYVLNYIFQDFGQPFLLPYTAALEETHVQVLFSSMTQALAACMAFGEWFEMSQKTDEFFYRVRINPCQEEDLLIKNSGGMPEEAYKLDYFVNARLDINQSLVSGEENQNDVPQNCQSSEFQSSEHKSKFSQEKSISHHSGISQMQYPPPVIFVPIFVPLRVTPAQTSDEEKTINANIDAAVFCLQNACIEFYQPGPVIDSEVQNLSLCDINKSSADSSGGKYQSASLPTVHEVGKESSTNLARDSNSSQTVVKQKPSHLSKCKEKKAYKGNSRRKRFSHTNFS